MMRTTVGTQGERAHGSAVPATKRVCAARFLLKGRVLLLCSCLSVCSCFLSFAYSFNSHILIPTCLFLTTSFLLPTKPTFGFYTLANMRFSFSAIAFAAVLAFANAQSITDIPSCAVRTPRFFLLRVARRATSGFGLCIHTTAAQNLNRYVTIH